MQGLHRAIAMSMSPFSAICFWQSKDTIVHIFHWHLQDPEALPMFPRMPLWKKHIQGTLAWSLFQIICAKWFCGTLVVPVMSQQIFAPEYIFWDGQKHNIL
jgi:hypothetical protein